MFTIAKAPIIQGLFQLNSFSMSTKIWASESCSSFPFRARVEAVVNRRRFTKISKNNTIFTIQPRRQLYAQTPTTTHAETPQHQTHGKVENFFYHLYELRNSAKIHLLTPTGSSDSELELRPFISTSKPWEFLIFFNRLSEWQE